MESRVGFLKESSYAAEGNVIRHGDTLRDYLVDQSSNMRVLGMVGLCNAEEVQSEVLNGNAPLGYIVLAQGESILTSKVRLTNSKVKVYGFDPDLLDVKQAIKVEMYGYTALSIITLREG